MKIIDCRVNHLKNPIGYRMERTVFSWKVTDAKGMKQEAARICVAADPKMQEILADTGFTAEADSLASKVDVTLLPRTRYYWTVTVRSDAQEEAVSEVNWFETSKMGESWQGKWITCDNTSKRHPIFEKPISLQGEIQSARLYICGLGLYEAYLNGQKVGEEYLTPYSNDYHTWLQYQTFDITSQLQNEEMPVLDVLMGNGWYKGRFGYMQREEKGFYGDRWCLLAEVRITYVDGTEQIVGTDESWNVKQSRITFSGIYDGEQVDDTLPEEAVVLAKLDETPPVGTLTARMSTPVRVREEFTPVEVIQTPAGETVLDMGQNFSGIFCLRVQEPEGTVVHLQFGEILQNGNFYNENLRSAKAEYRYVSDGKEKVIRPHFTYYGYRYVKVEGISNLNPEDFTGQALYSELTPAGRLTTGNELVNRLVENTRWGLKSNFLDVPTDCPQRDERMGWTGDAQVFCPTASFLEESYAFYEKYLYDCWMEQTVTGGRVPDVIPSAGHGQKGSSVWGDAVCIIPWTLYLFYGDKSILETQYESMRSWVEYVRSVDGTDCGWRKHFHYGDWLALDNPKGGADQTKGGTEDGFIASIYYGGSADILAKTARLLGKESDAAEYEQLSEEIFQAVRDEYYSKNGRCCITTQTGYLLTLSYGLSSNPELMREMLRKKFEDSDYKLQTGFVGTPILCNVLSENGMEDIAYRLLLNEEYPGWLHEIKLGATTIWERWNSVNDDGSISSTGMNSLNHYSYGSIVEWMFRHVAGINPDRTQPGFRHVILKPTPNWQLKQAAADYDSPAGRYHVEWEIVDETHVRVKAEIPFGCTADLELYHAAENTFAEKDNPMFAEVRDRVCVLQTGIYEVVYETTEPLRKKLSSYTPICELLQNETARQMLPKMLPGMDQMPSSMMERSMRQILQMYGNAQMEGMLAKVDEMLAGIDG